MVNSFTGDGLVSLIGHVEGSGAQATLILARFWGEILGQVPRKIAVDGVSEEVTWLVAGYHTSQNKRITPGPHKILEETKKRK